MKIKFDDYVNRQFKKTPLGFETKNGLLYYKKSEKWIELPDQTRNLEKLYKILDNHPNNDDFNTKFFAKDMKPIKQSITKRKREKAKIERRKTKKSFFGF
jgi:hypothetical protein